MKIARLKGYAPIWIVGSRSDGLGFKGAGSNRGRRIRIGRRRLKGARGRRRDAPPTCSRGGGRPEVANLGLPGGIRAGLGSRSL